MDRIDEPLVAQGRIGRRAGLVNRVRIETKHEQQQTFNGFGIFVAMIHILCKVLVVG